MKLQRLAKEGGRSENANFNNQSNIDDCVWDGGEDADVDDDRPSKPDFSKGEN